MLCSLLFLLGTLLAFGAESTNTLDQAFQSALLAEEARRDLDAAVKGYEEVVSRFDAQRTLVATAMFRLGECYRKLGRNSEAIAQYQRLLHEFPGETTLARLARENLVALGAPPPEALPTNAAAVTAAASPPAENEEDREIRRLRILFERSPDLLNAFTEGHTPLSLAASRGQAAVVHALLEWGADVHAGQEAALRAAAGAGHKVIVERLLDAKANPNALDREGRTPLALAVARGFSAVVETLLARGADPRQDPEHSALFAAAEAGQVAMIERLVRAGADVNGTRKQRPGGEARINTPLAAAVAARQREASRALVKLGAIASGEGNFHPLTVAIRQFGDADWARELLKAAPKEGFSPDLLANQLELVVRNTALESLIPDLIQAGASVETQFSDRSLVAATTEIGSVRALELVLEARPNLQATGRNGLTALHVAAYRGRTNQIALLLRAGADPNALTKDNSTPLALVKTEAGRSETDPKRNPNPEVWRVAEALLRAAGARDDVARRLTLGVRRNSADQIIWSRGSPDQPPPRLGDLLAATFTQGSTVANGLSFPDLRKLRVFRLTDDGTGEFAVPVDGNWHNATHCDWNLPLQWGDSLEIPQEDHRQNAVWYGLPGNAWAALLRCTERRVSLRIKDETFELRLRPGDPVNGDRRRLTQLPPGTPTDYLPEVTSLLPDNPHAISLSTVWLDPAIRGSGRLRVSSDLTRVKVTRTATGATWILNVAGDEEAKSFWLLDGDQIEVPEKQP